MGFDLAHGRTPVTNVNLPVLVNLKLSIPGQAV